MGTLLTTETIINTPVAYSGSITLNSFNDFQKQLLEDDLENVFFNEDEFAEAVNYYHSAIGKYRTYFPIYDKPSTSLNIAEEEAHMRKPQLQLRANGLLHKVLKGDRVVVKGKTYFVENYDNPGLGVITIFLRLK